MAKFGRAKEILGRTETRRYALEPQYSVLRNSERSEEKLRLGLTILARNDKVIYSNTDNYFSRIHERNNFTFVQPQVFLIELDSRLTPLSKSDAKGIRIYVQGNDVLITKRSNALLALLNREYKYSSPSVKGIGKIISTSQ